MEVIDNAEKILKFEKDPVKKQLIQVVVVSDSQLQDYIEELREKSKGAIRSAQSYKESPTNEEHAKNFDAAYGGLMNSIQKLEVTKTYLL